MGALWRMAVHSVACVQVVALAKSLPLRQPAELDTTSTAAWGQAAYPISIAEQAATEKTHPAVMLPHDSISE